MKLSIHLPGYLLAERYIFSQWHGSVIVFLIVVHPNFGGSSSVLGKHISRSAREGVGMSLSEDVTNPRTGDDFQTPTTLPHSEGDFWNHKRRVEEGVQSIRSNSQPGRIHCRIFNTYFRKPLFASNNDPSYVTISECRNFGTQASRTRFSGLRRLIDR